MLTREKIALLELELEAMRLKRAALKQHVREQIGFLRYMIDIELFINSVQRTIRGL